jgi:hypothetical protein
LFPTRTIGTLKKGIRLIDVWWRRIYSLSFAHHIYEFLVNNFDDFKRLLASYGVDEHVTMEILKTTVSIKSYGRCSLITIEYWAGKMLYSSWPAVSTNFTS